METQGFLSTEAIVTTVSFSLQPERINPPKDANGYDIRSDVWSLGITVVRCAIKQL